MIAPKPMIEAQTACRILAVTSSQTTVERLQVLEHRSAEMRNVQVRSASWSVRCCEFDFRAVEIVTRAMHQGEPYAVVVVDTQQIPETLAVPLINALHQVDPGLQLLVLATQGTPMFRHLMAVTEAEDRLAVVRTPCEDAELRQMLSVLTVKWAGEWQARHLRAELEGMRPATPGDFNLDAVGSLAAGIAHQFNNVLTVIQNQIDLALQQMGNPQEMEHLLTQVLDTARDAAALSRKLVRLSPAEFGPAETVDLAQAVDEETALLGKTLGEDIAWQVDRSDELLTVLAPPALISQMILNVAVHARRTMPEGGTLHFSTRRVRHETGNRHARHFPRVQHREYVLLTIEDPNPGTHSDSVPTSQDERLIWMQEAMHGCGGAFNATLVPGMVKTYELLFPLAEPTPVVREATPISTDLVLPPEAAKPPLPIAGLPSQVTILAVDDDETISLIMGQVLGTRGHRTLMAHNADEAWRIWQQSRNSIHMVITDINMPGGANGVALADAIKEDDATVPIIYTSGHRATAIYPHLKPGLNYLPKPFGMSDLLKIVEANLAGRQSHGMI